jgi:hypothetical protein
MRLIALSLAVSAAFAAQPPDAREIIRRSVATADRNWKARQNYTYNERAEERRVDSGGSVKVTNVDISRIVVVNGVPVEQIVQRNGAPPSASTRRKDEEKLRKVQRETPYERSARLAKDRENLAFVDEVPDAFNFRLIGEETIEGRETYIIEAKPKPGFRGRAKYARMFPKVTSTLWVDKRDYGWVKADATVIAPISLGLILARVQPGSHIVFEQMRIADGTWLPKRIQVRADARILFVKNYQVDEVITYSDYQPAHGSEVASSIGAR